MVCPKCEEQAITQVQFKKNDLIAYLCDLCGTVWFDGKNVQAKKYFTIQSLTQDDDMAYTYTDNEPADQDDRSVLYTKYK